MDLIKITPSTQAQHLDKDILRAYRHAFMGHPAHLLVLRSFLQEDVAKQISKFLTDEAKYRQAYGLYSAADSVPKDEWLNAPEENRFYTYGLIDEIPTEFRLSPNLFIYLKFTTALVDSKFKPFFEAISGLSLGNTTEVQVHSTTRGDFLRPHNDKGRNRRLAFVLYLSADWEPRFGGALHIIHRDGAETVIEAEYNSLMIFDVTAHKHHFIAPITPAAGERARLSIGGWVHNPE
jgi:Rps23 Pro-64 3,4-dihydroxylase Tpa1-like proline 4-hydroxylase